MEIFKKASIYLLGLAATSFFCSCIVTMGVREMKGPIKEDKISSVEKCYVSNLNTLVVQFEAKLGKKKGKTNYYYEVDFDELLHTAKNANYDVSDEHYFYRNDWELPDGINHFSRSFNGDKYTIVLNRGGVKQGFSELCSRDDIMLIKDTSQYSIMQDEDIYYSMILHQFPARNIPELYPMESIDLYLTRRHGAAWYKCFLYPVSIPLDIVTSPIQLVVAIMVAKAYGNMYRP